MTNSAILVLRNIFIHHSSKGRVKNGNKENVAMNGTSRNGGAASSNDPEQEATPESLLPRYLRPLVRHYHDDFYVSRSFDPRLIVQLMAEGFLPIATSGYLLPKLHVERCVLKLSPESELHVSKSVRKKSKRFLLSVNECFDRVVAGCHKQHGTNWLYPQIVSAFRVIHQHTAGGAGEVSSGGVDAMIMDDGAASSHRRGPRPAGVYSTDVTPVRLYSVEVWNAETGALAGGELGYSVGGIYSSLTGFSVEDAAGSSQLVALGRLLTKCGFEYWDLGMDLDYKRRLGAKMMRRTQFVREVRRSRIENKGVELQCGDERMNAKELVDWKKNTLALNQVCENGSTCENGNKPQPSVPPSKSDGNGKVSQPSVPPNEVDENRKEPQSLCLQHDEESDAHPSRKRPHDDEKGGMSDS